MSSDNTHKPYIPASQVLPEITIKGIIIAIILGMILTAANVYLGLYVGMTVSASIPAAVISMATLRTLANSKYISDTNILENNWVQTAVSAGESLAAGVIFTLPALIIMEQGDSTVWSDFPYFTTFAIALIGGTIGVLFSISLRQIFVVKEKLPYPEGVACAEVLMAGEKGGAQVKPIFFGLLFGTIFKLGASLQIVKDGFIQKVSLGLWKNAWHGHFTIKGKLAELGSVEKVRSTIFLGAELSPALLGVGYIVGPAIGTFVFLGGLLGAIIILPMTSGLLFVPDGMAISEYISFIEMRRRMVGVGTMLIGGLYTLVLMRKPITRGITDMIKKAKQSTESSSLRTEMDLPANLIAKIIGLSLIPILLLIWGLSKLFAPALIALIIIFTAGYLFAAIAGYMAGIVGSSNNPLSGVTIIVVIFTSSILALLNKFFYGGAHTEDLQIAVIGAAAFVACAGAISGDNLQDLKTGYILGATPWKLQIGQMIGVAAGALVIPLVLNLLTETYTLGKELSAPQAFLMERITTGILTGEMDWSMVFLGSGLAFCLIALRHLDSHIIFLSISYAFFAFGGYVEGAFVEFMFMGAFLVGLTLIWINQYGGLEISIMAVAVGMYLSLAMCMPIMVGGMIKYYVDRRFNPILRKNQPTLYHEENHEVLEVEKEKLHSPGILFASGLIAGEAITGILLAAFAVSGIYLGILSNPTIIPGLLLFIYGGVLIAYFSLLQMESSDFGKPSSSETIFDGEMLD
tara:strand:- start:256 stop:2493 length:2238 start_codon:yes stop_codon:yes gene_type:complete